MTCVVNFVFALSQLQGVSGDGLVGGNPTMNTPRLRWGLDSFLFIYFIFLPVLVFVYYSIPSICL